MSFSVSFVGRPEAIKRALAKASAQKSGQSKEELDAAIVGINQILDQNVNETEVLSVQASGHASIINGVKTYGNCRLNIASVGTLAE